MSISVSINKEIGISLSKINKLRKSIDDREKRDAASFPGQKTLALESIDDYEKIAGLLGEVRAYTKVLKMVKS